MASSPRRRDASDTVFDYDLEPVDERPSEFASYEPLSGFHRAPVQVRPARRGSRFGFKAMLLATAVLVALGTWGLRELVTLLHR